MKDLVLWRFIVDSLASQAPVRLLAVVHHTPGSPGRQGFMLAINSRGQACGTIGGGVMEFKLVERARRQLERHDSEVQWFYQHHNKTAPSGRSGMICAGSQLIVSCPLGLNRLAELYGVVERLSLGQRVALRLSCEEGVSFPDSPLMANSGKAARIAWGQTPGSFSYYEEALGPQMYVSIVGGGHVGLALSRVVACLDAYVCVFDHRPKLATFSENTFAHRLILGPYEDMPAYICQGEASYAAVVSTSFLTDAAALRQLVPLKLRYLGVMGSQAKIAHLTQTLRGEGFRHEDLEKIRAPIGLAIASRTCEEIAISIAAEMIKIKNTP